MAIKTKNKKNNEVVENIAVDTVNTNFEETTEVKEDVKEEAVKVEESIEIESATSDESFVESVEEPFKEEVKLSAKELFFNNLKDVKHYELTFRNNKVYDTVKDLGVIIPVPMDDVILIGNTYFPYAGLTINIK